MKFQTTSTLGELMSLVGATVQCLGAVLLPALIIVLVG